MDKFLKKHKTDSNPTKKSSHSEAIAMNSSKHFKEETKATYTNSPKE